MATDSTDSAVLADEKSLDKSLPEKIVLPTNESSERLLRIRHTVIFYLFICLSVYCPGILFGCWEHDGEEKKKYEKLEVCSVSGRSEGGNRITWCKVASS